MYTNKSCLRLILIFCIAFLIGACAVAEADDGLKSKCLETMKKATRYMVEQVSTNGGYVWHYLPDFSRRWGEMEAYETMIWVQPPGTTSMGHLFLDAYQATGDEYYYEAAQKAAQALIQGQLDCGGWNYVIDFAGEESLKKWYQTIGKNGWRLEEFQHYYGNATFDDNVSTDAARFLLRMYLEKQDPAYKCPLDKAIDFVIESQYPLGGWPQRYPLRYEFRNHGKDDYTSYFTFNDSVVWQNVDFLIECHLALDQQRFLEPIYKGMDFYLITQQAKPQAGWAQQYTMDLKPAGARTYEPKALSPDYTAAHIRLLIRFYRMTGQAKYLARIPEAFDWLDSCKLDESQTEDGRYTHPRYVEIGTNKPLFVHRKGSNVVHGCYYVDYNDCKLSIHNAGKRYVDVNQLRHEFEEVKNMSFAEATKDSPLLTPQPKGAVALKKYRSLYLTSELAEDKVAPDEKHVKNVIEELDKKDRWLCKNVFVSNPYIGDGTKTEATDKYVSTYVGDETDTSPYRDESSQDYISTKTFINNMKILMSYVAGN